MNLQDIRHTRAEAAYQAFWFARGITMEDPCTWEYTSPGREMTRKVFFTYDNEQDSDSLQMNFTVVFASDDSPVVVEAYALRADTGGEMGHMPKKSVEERVNDKMSELAAAMLTQMNADKAGGTVDFLQRMRRSGRGPAA